MDSSACDGCLCVINLNVTLNIAVTGEREQGGKKLELTKTTMKPIRYSHHTVPNVKFWDLPGTGTPNIKAKKFKENNIMLAKEIQNMKNMFYFVRSGIDNDSLLPQSLHNLWTRLRTCQQASR
uniref:Immunity-related GTPase family, e4 n=1 Tax=Oncorhynchus mykiss TaxID=8022 RepID=A0A8C7VZN5_ONCMY